MGLEGKIKNTPWRHGMSSPIRRAGSCVSAPSSSHEIPRRPKAKASRPAHVSERCAPETSRLFPPAPRSTKGKPQEKQQKPGRQITCPWWLAGDEAPERATLAATQDNILIQQAGGDRGDRTKHVHRGSACACDGRSRGSPFTPGQEMWRRTGRWGAACRCPCLCGNPRALPSTPGVEVGGWAGGKCSRARYSLLNTSV